MNIDFKGYGENAATFAVTGTIEAGDFVSVSSNFTVAKASAGDDIIGICLNVRDGYAAVQLGGYVEAAAAEEISLGNTGITLDSNGKLVASNSAAKHLVVFATETKAGFIL